MFSFILLSLGIYLIYFAYKQYETDSLSRNEKILKLENKLEQEMFKIKQESTPKQNDNKIGIQDSNRFLRIVYDPLKSPEQIYQLGFDNNRRDQSRFLDKIYNPLHPPENIIPQGGFYNKGYDSYQNYQMIGFISNEQGQFPVYGRNKDNNNNRYEYYTINESRNHIKIPFSVKNAELYSDDQVKVPELSGKDFIFKKYENAGIKYNPNLI